MLLLCLQNYLNVTLDTFSLYFMMRLCCRAQSKHKPTCFQSVCLGNKLFLVGLKNFKSTHKYCFCEATELLLVLTDCFQNVQNQSSNNLQINGKKHVCL